MLNCFNLFYNTRIKKIKLKGKIINRLSDNIILKTSINKLKHTHTIRMSALDNNNHGELVVYELVYAIGDWPSSRHHVIFYTLVFSL